MANLKHRIICFRPHEDLKAEFEELLHWCESNETTFSSIINSYLPAICYAIRSQMIIDTDTGNRYIRSDFADVLLRDTLRRQIPNPQ